jgi:hypothetical protein
VAARSGGRAVHIKRPIGRARQQRDSRRDRALHR